MARAQEEMGSSDPEVHEAAMGRYGRLEDRFLALGGYAAEAEAAAIASNPGAARPHPRPVLSTLSGGQRRRIELARILFSGSDTMLLDEPTNHLDADSVIWLREFLKAFDGGLVVISHDVELVQDTVNKVFYLDANRQRIDQYNMGWKNYLRQREADEERRKKERANAREEGDRAPAPGREIRREGDEGGRGPPDGRPCRAAARGLRRGSHQGSGREAALPRAGGLRSHPAHRARPHARATARSRSSPRSTWRSTAARKWSCWD